MSSDKEGREAVHAHGSHSVGAEAKIFRLRVVSVRACARTLAMRGILRELVEVPIQLWSIDRNRHRRGRFPAWYKCPRSRLNPNAARQRPVAGHGI